jgi:hypothetical protein
MRARLDCTLLEGIEETMGMPAVALLREDYNVH